MLHLTGNCAVVMSKTSLSGGRHYPTIERKKRKSSPPLLLAGRERGKRRNIPGRKKTGRGTILRMAPLPLPVWMQDRITS